MNGPSGMHCRAELKTKPKMSQTEQREERESRDFKQHFERKAPTADSNGEQTKIVKRLRIPAVIPCSIRGRSLTPVAGCDFRLPPGADTLYFLNHLPRFKAWELSSRSLL
jgi:hypothetical protein